MHRDTLSDVIRINAATWPTKPAFICQGEQRTFAQFNERVNRLVNALYRSGLSKGDRIGILSSNRIEFAECYGAAEKGGFIAVTLNIRHTTADIAYVVEHSGLNTIFVEGPYVGLVKQLPLARIYVFRSDEGARADYEALISSGSSKEPDIEIASEDGVYMMYTGGTTGRPKGVLLDHGGQMANAKCTVIDAAVEPHDILLTVMPMHHIGGKNFCTVHFHRGCTKCLLIPAFQPAAVLEAMAEHKIRCVLLAPTMIKMLLDELAGSTYPGLALKTVYYSLGAHAGRTAPPSYWHFRKDIRPVLWPDESGPSGSMLRRKIISLTARKWNSVVLSSAGRPQIYNEIKIIDDNRNSVPVGAVGEVLIRGEQVMQRYWNNEVATAETLQDGWIASGDYGQLDEDGYLYIVGRRRT